MIKVVVMPIFLLNATARRESLQGVKGLTLYGIQLMPFEAIRNIIEIQSFAGIIQIVGNLLLLVPLAFLITWVFSKDNILVLIITGLLMTELIECIQLAINIITKYPGHAVDIDDVIFNYVGYIIAVFVILLVKKKCNKTYQNVRKVFIAK